MPIPFNSIPHSRVPFIYVEFDNDKAQRHDFDLIYRVLLIGKKTDGLAELDKPYLIQSVKDAKDKFGATSELHQMAEAFLANAKESKLYAACISDGAKDLKDLFAKIKDSQFHIIVSPQIDLIKGLEGELAERFSPKRQLEGHVIAAIKGDVKETVEKGKGLSSPHVTLIAAGKSNLTSETVWASAVAGVIASYGQEDPAAPFKSCPILGVIADSEEERFTRSEREELLKNGISTSYTQF